MHEENYLIYVHIICIGTQIILILLFHSMLEYEMVYKLYKRPTPARLAKSNVDTHYLSFEFHLAYRFYIRTTYYHDSLLLFILLHYGAHHVASYNTIYGCRVDLYYCDWPQVVSITNIREVTENAVSLFRERIERYYQTMEKFYNS